MKRLIKKMGRFPLFLAFTLILSGCNGLNEDISSYIMVFSCLMVFLWICFGMVVIGGIGAIIKNEGDKRNSSIAVGLAAVAVCILIVFILLA